jgi:hypothetical protein
MSYTLLAAFVTGGFATVVLLVLWLLAVDSRTNTFDSAELDFFDAETNIR